ncbi:Septum formation protein Maf [Labilithrix luteola]|uniref:dTTP/UTP pyrophosphatase n=1 Tax=Labilithrix luteola TaxID=1391654 RepID=A0A0K1Q9W8_9BACT|nr:Maf family protein [Labilithrix luteola]AKV02462.1 Septum formation protein Maf [Labilithrix luteola]
MTRAESPVVGQRLSAERPLLLASGSPRRREILENLRVPFIVRPASADESTRDGEDAAAYLARVVLAKLDAAWAAGGSALENAGAVLVADTSVIDEGAILGKPGSIDEAEAMIARLAGKTHEVWTRFAIGRASAAGGTLHEQTVVTRVTFRPLTAARIRAYAESGEGMDKAGAYAVQGLGAGLVARVDGSYSNVVGLPACEVLVALEELGLVP